MAAEALDKLYYSIGEVAGLLGIPTSKIRFWETEFDHLRPKKNARGDRRYTQKDIDAIRQIQHLVKEKGFTLQGAKDYLGSRSDSRRQETIEALEGVKRFLLEIKARLPQGNA